MRPVPFRVIALHRLAVRVERVAAVELERLVAAILVVAHLAREGLQRDRRKMREQLGDVAAAVHAGETLLERLAKSVHEIEPGERAVVGRDPVAEAGVGHRIDRRRGGDDVVLPVDGEPHPHVVHRGPGRTHAAGELIVLRLHVLEMRLEVPEPVGAAIALESDAARVGQSPRCSGRRQRHASDVGRGECGAVRRAAKSSTRTLRDCGPARPRC